MKEDPEMTRLAMFMDEETQYHFSLNSVNFIYRLFATSVKSANRV
jgi:hypothetical protein